ncbi:hypothetical protein AB4371_22090 [Vibrio sp. 10N.261.51.A3]|uniref:hypothetical protein n=1 Tax=unclassified Vibrio TaxID=2614977 RepID=UPI0035536849
MFKLRILFLVVLASLISLAASAASNRVEADQELLILKGNKRSDLIKLSNPVDDIAYVETHVVEVTFDENGNEQLELVEGEGKKDSIIVIPEKGLVPPKSSVQFRVVKTAESVVKDRYFKVRFVPVTNKKLESPNSKDKVNSGIFISIATSGFVAISNEDSQPDIISTVDNGILTLKNNGNGVGTLTNCTLCSEEEDLDCKIFNDIRMIPNRERTFDVGDVGIDMTSVVFNCDLNNGIGISKYVHEQDFLSKN